MADRFRLTLAQLNPTVGAIAENIAKVRAAWEEGRAAGAPDYSKSPVLLWPCQDFSEPSRSKA